MPQFNDWSKRYKNSLGDVRMASARIAAPLSFIPEQPEKFKLKVHENNKGELEFGKQRTQIGIGEQVLDHGKCDNCGKLVGSFDHREHYRKSEYDMQYDDPTKKTEQIYPAYIKHPDTGKWTNIDKLDRPLDKNMGVNCLECAKNDVLKQQADNY
jgi:hypothetical protein